MLILVAREFHSRRLRPGGLERTRRMVKEIDVRPSGSVVEFAPGLGMTAQTTLRRRPASYVAVERDEAAARMVRGYLSGPEQWCLVVTAEDTALADSSAGVV